MESKSRTFAPTIWHHCCFWTVPVVLYRFLFAWTVTYWRQLQLFIGDNHWGNEMGADLSVCANLLARNTNRVQYGQMTAAAEAVLLSLWPSHAGHHLFFCACFLSSKEAKLIKHFVEKRRQISDDWLWTLLSKRSSEIGLDDWLWCRSLETKTSSTLYAQLKHSAKRQWGRGR